jgi:hypothetical protein
VLYVESQRPKNIRASHNVKMMIVTMMTGKVGWVGRHDNNVLRVIRQRDYHPTLSTRVRRFENVSQGYRLIVNFLRFVAKLFALY